jgi:microcystin-dependent protein
LHNVFPLGMIMLFSGKTPPRGWLECNGKGGTPLILSPAKDVIYVIRR